MRVGCSSKPGVGPETLANTRGDKEIRTAYLRLYCGEAYASRIGEEDELLQLSMYYAIVAARIWTGVRFEYDSLIYPAMQQRLPRLLIEVGDLEATRDDMLRVVRMCDEQDPEAKMGRAVLRAHNDENWMNKLPPVHSDCRGDYETQRNEWCHMVVTGCESVFDHLMTYIKGVYAEVVARAPQGDAGAKTSGSTGKR